MRAREVPGPERGGEAVARRVRELHRLVHAVERLEGGDRSEDLLLVRPARGPKPVDDRRLDEPASAAAPLEARPLSAAEHAAAFLPRQLQTAHHLVEMLPRDERSLLGRRVERISDAQGARLRDQPLLDLLVRGALHQDSRPAEADLPLVLERGSRGLRHRVIEVRVGEDQVRVLAAHLQRRLDEPLGSLSGDLAAHARRSGEAHRPDFGVRNQGAARAGPQTLYDVQHSRREARLAAQLAEKVRGHGRHFARLRHHAVPRRERGRHLPGEQVEGQVPGRDAGDDSERLPERVVQRHLVGGMRLAVPLRDRVGEEVEVLRSARHFDRRGERDGLPAVDRLGACEPVLVPVDQARHGAQEPRALTHRRRRPGGKCAACRRDRPLHVRRVARCDSTVRRPGRRVDVVEPLRRGDVLAVDVVEGVHLASYLHSGAVRRRGSGVLT